MLIYFITFIWSFKNEIYNLYTFLIYYPCVFVFYNKYDHGYQFHLGYSHDLNQQYKSVASTHPDVLVFFVYSWECLQNALKLTPIDMDEKWHGLIL